MTKRFRFTPPGGGLNYDWSADHTFVKTSAEDTNGAYTLMEDNLKSSFRLGLHVHRHHAETFYILDGVLDFYVDGEWVRAGPGATLHIPPGAPHGCALAAGTTAGRMLMIFQPAGFDQYLAALSALSDAELNDPAVIDALNETHDIIQLGELPERR